MAEALKKRFPEVWEALQASCRVIYSLVILSRLYMLILLEYRTMGMSSNTMAMARSA